MVALPNILVAVSFLASAGLGSALPPRVGTTVISDRTGDTAGFSKSATGSRASLKQIRNPRYRGATGTGALSVYKTYLKYGAPVPSYLLKAVATSLGTSVEELQKRQDGAGRGTAPAVPIDENDIAYITPVSIGTPPQVSARAIGSCCLIEGTEMKAWTKEREQKGKRDISGGFCAS